MHNRLLPLTPPSPTPTRQLQRRVLKRSSALPSMPWMEFGLVALLLFWVIRLGA